MASHYCWHGCGCAEYYAKLEGRFPTPFQFELTAPPVFGSYKVTCGQWPMQAPINEEEMNEKFNTTMLAIFGGQLVGELMTALLWFLFYDE